VLERRQDLRLGGCGSLEGGRRWSLAGSPASAPRGGFEPPTYWLLAPRSFPRTWTISLPWRIAAL